MSSPPSHPKMPAPSTTYLVVTGIVAVVGLLLAFAAAVPSIVGVIAILPLLLGLQQIGVRKRQERQDKRAREQGSAGSI